MIDFQYLERREADLLRGAECEPLHVLQQQPPRLGEVSEGVEQRALGDEHPRHAGDGQHLGLGPLLVLRVPAVVNQQRSAPIRLLSARQPGLDPNLQKIF